MEKLLTKVMGLTLNTLAVLAPKKTAQVGFELFCRPFRATINDKQKAFFNTALKKSFQFKNIDIQTYRWGTGPKNILLLHGWQSHTYRWKIYIESLSKDYTVHAFDAPGHGLSSGKMLHVPLYSDVIEEQIKRIGDIDTIITHSLGGFATFFAFYRNPKLTAKKIVAMASPGEAQEFFNFYKKSLDLSDRCSKLVIDRFEETFQRTPSFFSAPVFASSLTIPGLIIHDEEDKETSFNHAQRIHQCWRNSKLIKTKGFGHNLKSPEVVREVIQFVNEPVEYCRL
ncbi:MAG TPA: alpha/beta hydrolase [Chryseolinea sp.]|nr:alpha/beta hydrolase [Chryseolinea sp.]